MHLMDHPIIWINIYDELFLSPNTCVVSLQEEKETMKEDLLKGKEDAVAERDRHWQDMMAQKQQEYQEALSNKVSQS